MPILKNRVAIEIARGVKAFLSLEAGVTRGELPWPGARVSKVSVAYRRTRRQVRRLGRAGGRLKRAGLRAVRGKPKATALRGPAKERTGNVNPKNIVWIFGIGRSGSTWLARMMEDLEGQTVWFEPRVGDVFDPIRLKTERRKGGKHFILGERYKASWIPLIRRFVLDGARMRFPEMRPDEYLMIKEPSGSSAAPFLMEAVPESRIVLLVRDPRDVTASWIDAHKKGDWVSERKQGGISPYQRKDRQLNNLVKKTARKYLRNIRNSMQAFESHGGYKSLVYYEDLRADPLGAMRRLYSEIGVEVDEKELVRVVEKHSWDRVPQEQKGEGKFYRKAKPGGWREDLTPRQVRMVEQITGPVIKELYPG